MASEYLMFFHIVFAFLLLAGVGIATAAGMKAEKESNVNTIHTLMRLDLIAENFLIIPSAILIGMFGVLTAWQQGRPLTGGTGEWWIVLSYITLGVALFLGVGVMRPIVVKAEKLAKEAVAKGQKTPELEKALASPVPKIVGNLLTLIIVFFLVLMVFKPF